ncbi:3-isopropylmalate dehydratase small subunit (plasmid) [Agrobacterium tumefaciens]|uniref:3-isopropylmalate dehydratase small subunit n=1 Tax=Agrobacterium tumefaciens TaxID=358 RepID=UPI001572CB55|nr:3-isopropylmalate dehydratase small subunit [Agrobacterium tumefaciens]NSZ87697.1 3-isopropylmalate dehydratase small subunit [Agrobacterium tumefaciens]WCA72898.1 3-isopropylmalate dehydratase small subunit [Agrobacterium tumefaciens]
MTRFYIVAAAVPLLEDNIDTDQISPGTELMRSPDDGYARWGEALFATQRYLPDRTPNPSFILNDPQWGRAEILLTGKNFGCGSSREWAVKALRGFGFRAILAVSFGEIFAANCFRHGVLPVELPTDVLFLLASEISHRGAGTCLAIDVESQVIVSPSGRSFPFELPEMQRRIFLEGIDEITFVSEYSSAVTAFERADQTSRPWKYPTEAPTTPT